MSAAADLVPIAAASDLANLEALCAHDALLRHFAAIDLACVRHLLPLAGSTRADTLPRACRRVAALPPRADLEAWYRTLRMALDGGADDHAARELVGLMMATLRGRPESDLVVEMFVLALRDAGVTPQILAGSVKRAWLECKTKPTLQAFLKLCAGHRADTQAALDQVVRTMGLRRDAETVAAGAPGDSRQGGGRAASGS